MAPMGEAVTQRIKSIRQPRGGYIPPSALACEVLSGGEDLAPQESVSPALTGTAVDSLTRFMTGTPLEEAYRISFLGADAVWEQFTAEELVFSIDESLDDYAVECAIRASGFDSAYRAGYSAYRPVLDIEVNADSIRNVREMVARSLRFFAKYGPKTKDGFTFEGGYTDVVSQGDGDFLTLDTLWDFKVSKYPPTKDHTLQILMYWRMGLRSVHPEFRSIRYLGIFNPRLNTVYRIAVDDIPQAVIDEVDTVVIGYNKLR